MGVQKLVKSNGTLCDNCIYADSEQKLIGIHWWFIHLAENWHGYISREGFIADADGLITTITNCKICMKAQQQGIEVNG